MPSIEEDFRAVVRQLLKVYPGASPLQAKDSHLQVSHVAHGWYMRCHRGVEAVLRLEEAGLQEEAGPIRRAVIEHVVALKYLAQDGNAVSTVLRRGASHETAKRKEALQSANWTSVDLADFDNVIADGAGLDARQDTLLHFKHRCDEYGTPHDWATYLNEVARCHPSWESAVPYIDLTGASVRVRSTPKWQIDQAGFCAIHLFEALAAYQEVFVDAPFDAMLSPLESRLKSLVVRQRRELGLPIPADLEQEVKE
jgi:hypothetical protein